MRILQNFKYPTKYKFLLAVITPVLFAAMTMFVSVAPVQAAEGCSMTSPYSYVCTNLTGNGTYVQSVASIRGETKSKAPYVTPICNTSAFVYYVPPSGGAAVSLGYQSRGGCVINRAWFEIPVNRNLPSGSRVCTKFMKSGVSVGPEPCVWVR